MLTRGNCSAMVAKIVSAAAKTTSQSTFGRNPVVAPTCRCYEACMSTQRITFVLLLALTGCQGTNQIETTEDELVLPRKASRIAVVGAGPSGLAAALTLKER